MTSTPTQYFNMCNHLFGNQARIDQAKEYLRHGTFPAKCHSRIEYAEKMKPFHLNYLGEIEDDMKRVVVKPHMKEKVIKQYRAAVVGRTSLLAFQKYIQTKFLNFTVKEIKQFLGTLSAYRANRRYQFTRIHAPILPEKFHLNSTWSVDLIDMSPQLDKARYILNCIDLFSRMSYLEAFNKKDAPSVLKAFKKICIRAKAHPEVVRSDGGLEFAGVFAAYLRENNIIQRVSQSHSPTQNSAVERSNQTVRKAIRSVQVSNNTSSWREYLPVIEHSLQNAYSKPLKATPQQIANAPTNDERKQKLIEENKQATSTFQNMQNSIKVGDYVLYKASLVFPKLRNLEKSNLGKNIVVRWYPVPAEITRVYQPKGLHRNWKRSYFFTDDFGFQRSVYFNDIQRVDSPDPIMTVPYFLRVNKLQRKDAAQ